MEDILRDKGHSENLEGEVTSQSSGLDTVLQQGLQAPCQDLRALGTWHQRRVKTGILRKRGGRVRCL